MNRFYLSYAVSIYFRLGTAIIILAMARPQTELSYIWSSSIKNAIKTETKRNNSSASRQGEKKGTNTDVGADASC